MKSLTKVETSKKLLYIVTFIWVVATIANYVLGYVGNEANIVSSTYEAVNSLFMLEIIAYSGKSGVENFTKIKTSVNDKVNDILK